MLIDCGSCVGDRTEFLPYVQNLISYVEGKLDLLVITHEHQDHINGFAKCEAEFEQLEIGEAWFAWTEDPNDPDQRALDLLSKRQKARLGLRNALDKLHTNRAQIRAEQVNLKANKQALVALDAFLDGMDTLGGINLDESPKVKKSLAGMRAVKELLVRKQVPIRYLKPGSSLALSTLPGVCFHALGPSLDRRFIYAEGKEGQDTYRRHEVMGEGVLAMNSLATLGQEPTEADLPFASSYVVGATGFTMPVPPHQEQAQELFDQYLGPDQAWRNIENEWLYTAGTLAIRLDSHINNTSLALAVELGKGGPVLLLPGDAEYANWAGWHAVEKWKGLGPNGTHFVEDLLNRTVFYKVSHHLSFNGTPLDKGLRLMNSPDLAVMVTLDRTRISSRWRTTMPNKRLLQELTERSQGRCILMNESDLACTSTTTFDLDSLGEARYQTVKHANRILAKQYTVYMT
ncbi:hypothetical protein J0X19_22925 [Hymenobacter sp. BT186]|uniref:Uncharacterized protein n=1 Tax=Hymenobacter telluris TaxID=2816474 RepID=A0A939F127_9BACT|nr:hypothetical protein [Hymenobacter telluris]MBO0360831.1 hypothetical protein [Hymenobacter telluris]MBW3376860.1 hypothetical protein [Hymenobacter norwichensis]